MVARADEKGSTAMRFLVVRIPSCWPTNLKRAVMTVIGSPGGDDLHVEVRESPSLPGHAAAVSLRPTLQLTTSPPTSALSGDRDAYEWETADGTSIIRGSNPRSVAFAIFEVAYRLGLRWITWMREPGYVPELAAPIPKRYQWRAAFPSTVVQLGISEQGREGMSQIQRQCRWLLFQHWNTYWTDKVDVSLAIGEFVQSFGLKYEIGGHSLKQTMPRRYFDERPDFFPIVRGKRTADLGDFAYGNPKAAEVVRREAAAIFYRHRSADRIHMWYDDVWLGAEDESTPSSWSPTRRAAEELQLVSGIHRDIAPNQQLVTLAYNAQTIPDRDAHFDPNVRVLYCPRERCQVHALNDRNCSRNREYLDLLKQWVDWLGPKRMLYLDYSLDHYIRVSTWGAHPSGEVLAADMRTLAEMGLESIHTLYFSDYSDVECSLVTYSLMHAAARPFGYDPDQIKGEYFRIVFGPHADIARRLYDLYAPVQAAFLRYDDYHGRKRDLRFAGLDQTKPSLQHARLLGETLRNQGRELDAVLDSVSLPSTDTNTGQELYRMITNMRFSLREFKLAAAMLEGVPYIRGENCTLSAKNAWLEARAELARLKADLQAVDADPYAAGLWSRSWLAGWSAQMGRCLQFGRVDERD